MSSRKSRSARLRDRRKAARKAKQWVSILNRGPGSEEEAMLAAYRILSSRGDRRADDIRSYLSSMWEQKRREARNDISKRRDS